jgi:hypothetical protein
MEALRTSVIWFSGTSPIQRTIVTFNVLTAMAAENIVCPIARLSILTDISLRPREQ